MTTAPTTTATARIPLNRLAWVGPLTIVLATLANVILQQLAVAVLQPDPAFMPLTLMPPIVFTVVGVLGAVITYAVIGRRAAQPLAQFRRVALIALIVSFVPDLLMLITGFNPGTTLANVVVLALMHVVAWAIAVGMLTQLAGPTA